MKSTEVVFKIRVQAGWNFYKVEVDVLTGFNINSIGVSIW